MLFYLIARPHLGTVWYVSSDGVVATPTPEPTIDVNDLHETATSKPHATLPPGLVPVVTPSLPATRFVDKRDCFDAVVPIREHGGRHWRRLCIDERLPLGLVSAPD